jgi:hypothetical protein
MILVMPLRAFGQLNMQRRRRLALLGIFMVGGIAVLASIVRLYALWVYSTTKDVAYDAIFVGSSSDLIGRYVEVLTFGQILLLSQIEVNVAIISASAPALRPFFKKTFQSSSNSRSKKRSESDSTSKPVSDRQVQSNDELELQPYNRNDSGRRTMSITGGDAHDTCEELSLSDGGFS